MTWLSDPAVLRPAVFGGLLLALCAAEWRWPRRRVPAQRRRRWPANLGLVLLGTLLLALLPLAALGTSLWAEARGWGLFHQLALPQVLEVALAWLLLDLAIYAQHRALHEVRALWPLHRVHHSDTVFDVSTGLRFHPAELLLSMLWKMGVVLLLGAPWLAVLLLELTLSGFALWSHANLRYPPWLERALRGLGLVTPDLHRVHHSVHPEETNSNYGSALMLWDHLFRTYRAAPREGHEAMRIGLAQWREPAQQTLGALLKQPAQD